MKFITDLFQNEASEWDLSRVILAALALGFLANAGWAVFHSHAFDAMNFGTGAGALLGGGGAGVWAHGKAP